MTPWTAAHQAPVSMSFSRQGYWSGLPFPSAGNLPNPGIEPRSPVLQEDSLLTELQGKPNVRQVPNFIFSIPMINNSSTLEGSSLSSLYMISDCVSVPKIRTYKKQTKYTEQIIGA